MDLPEQPFIKWFRNSSPYINAHRGRVFVVYFAGEVLHQGALAGLVQDISLLANLGVHLVLVHGAQPQIQARLQAHDMELTYHQGLPVVDAAALSCIKQAIGTMRLEIEAHFSAALASHPMISPSLPLVSGNLILARPLGVREGIDHLYSGEVRRLDTQAVRTYLTHDCIVLLSPLGYSPTREMFYLDAEEVATVAAIELRADKLLFLSEQGHLVDAQGQPVGELEPNQAQSLAQAAGCHPEHKRQLAHSVRACRAGVRRAHIVPRKIEGALVQELYTRDGVGTLITAEHYDALRDATIDDVGGILTLIAPLEAEGVLVQRSREQLELEIANFVVMERDGMILACAALYEYPEHVGEIACVVVHPDYRNHDRGEKLLEHLERRARKRGIERLFVLTTRTAHWFIEQGFEPAELDELPVAKRALYNYRRNSKVFIKPLLPDQKRVARQ